ncbi:nitrogen fixation protein NifZ [Bradyrhizobium brasilense]|uniref:nitrogen fixation protein NifZ n=1 Tax=Bradyrhizobium brasilense TaxID=1419277 RepID=UPI003221D4B5
MSEPGFPKYRRSQRGETAVDIINAGSFPNAKPDGVSLGAGVAGEIIRVAIHTEANVPIYTVILESGCSSAVLKKKSQFFEGRLSR